jgi:hypothetical protein
MLDIELDEKMGIAIVRPDGALSENDFDVISSVIDPYLDKHEKLAGLIISTETFPGWESFASFLKHFKFVKGHHKNLSHVALITDSEMGNVAEKIAGHFVSAKIKHFPYNQIDEAKSWINS